MIVFSPTVTAFTDKEPQLVCDDDVSVVDGNGDVSGVMMRNFKQHNNCSSPTNDVTVILQTFYCLNLFFNLNTLALQVFINLC